VPVFAICRGVQVLNVAAGGTLVQDIPSAVHASCRTRSTCPRITSRTPVRVTPGTRLAASLGLDAGSRRARSTAATTRRSAGRAVVRGLGRFAGRRRRSDRAPASAFCVGVQWHPENFWRTGEFAPLFEAFITRRSAGAD
jgi:putative glutamine amidotransferase